MQIREGTCCFFILFWALACGDTHRDLGGPRNAGGAGGATASNVAGSGGGGVVGTAGTSTNSAGSSNELPNAGSGGSAGGHAGSSNGAGNAGTGGTGPDLAAPTVVSVVPANNATGVLADANIVITFSEAMDRTSTQAAYQSAAIPSAGVVFSWSSDSKVLTINPNSNLPYAAGSSPTSVQATKFDFAIGTGGEDVAGNALATEFKSTFSTLRRISTTLESSGANSRKYSSSGSTENCGPGGTDLLSVGDGVSNEKAVVIAQFPLNTLPQNVHSFENATFTYAYGFSNGTPFNDLKPGIRVHHIYMNPLSSSVVTSAPLRELFLVNTTVMSGSALPAVQDDYAKRTSRSNLSQYRLDFEKISDGDESVDTAVMGCKFQLALEYLVP